MTRQTVTIDRGKCLVIPGVQATLSEAVNGVQKIIRARNVHEKGQNRPFSAKIDRVWVLTVTPRTQY